MFPVSQAADRLQSPALPSSEVPQTVPLDPAMLFGVRNSQHGRALDAGSPSFRSRLSVCCDNASTKGKCYMDTQPLSHVCRTRMCMSIKFPGGGDAAGPGPTLGTPILERWLFRGSFESLMLTWKL